MNGNQNGWSLKTCLIFIAVFSVLLLVSIFFYFRATSTFKNSINPVSSSSVSSSHVLTESDKKYYESVISNMEYKSTLYVNQYSIFNKDHVSLNVLVANNFMSKVYDVVDNSECHGYVTITREEEIVTKAYLKCSNFTSNGYEENKAND